uniref:Uncharacterized protein n=1 Tax=Romanomermis culicivorax TaxID=13658 RepID=A0A915IG82_ROMCU
ESIPVAVNRRTPSPSPRKRPLLPPADQQLHYPYAESPRFPYPLVAIRKTHSLTPEPVAQRGVFFSVKSAYFDDFLLFPVFRRLSTFSLLAERQTAPRGRTSMKWEEETRKKNGKGHGNDEIGFYDIWEHHLQQLGNDL